MSENIVRKEPRTLGQDLPPVGPIAFGLWRYTTEKLDKATELLETAIELGMNLIDNADVYGFDWGGKGFGACEELLGKVIKANPVTQQLSPTEGFPKYPPEVMKSHQN